MKKALLTIIVLIITIMASGCTIPPDKNIHLQTVTISSTKMKIITSPTFVTQTVTRTKSTITTETFIDVITITSTVSHITTYTSIVTVSSASQTVVTKRFTVFMNIIGDGRQNAVFFSVYPIDKPVTYTISSSIILTYTPYTTLFPGSTITPGSYSILLVPKGNTTTVYWPEVYGTHPVVTTFFRVIFSWWDCLYMKKLISLVPTQTNPLDFYLYIKTGYTYNTIRAMSGWNILLPHEFATQSGGHDADFVEYFLAGKYALEQPATAIIVSYSGVGYHFVILTSGKIIDPNTRYFDGIEDFVNVYGKKATITIVTLGTYTPAPKLSTTVLTPTPIMFLNSTPSTITLTGIETRYVRGENTTKIQYVITKFFTMYTGLRVVDNGTERSVFTVTGDDNAITFIYLGATFTHKIGASTLFFMGGRLTLPPSPMAEIIGYPFRNDIITYARVVTFTTVVKGFDVNKGTATYFTRSKVGFTEYYYYTVVETMYSITLTSGQGTIYYSE